jgi:membrane-bound lytic murein transglycosylase D
MALYERWPSIPAALAALTALVACAPARAQSVPEAIANGASSSGASPAEDTALGSESSALAALREVEAAPLALTAAVVSASGAGAQLPDQALDPTRLRTPELIARITPTLLATAERYRADRRSRRTMRGWYRDAGRFRQRIEQWLRAEAMPAELLWVAAAESGFNPHSESSAGAVGLWQLMPDTARSYGLRVDAWVDERKDPEKATRAAARLLRDLRARFGSWELALAAYNMGYGALLRSIRRFNTTDFETLATTEGALPFETAKYVPRILSLVLAAANPQAFGLEDVTPEPPVAWEDAPLTRSVLVEQLARGLNVDLRELRRLNPSLLGGRTPIVSDPSRPFVLHLPAGAPSRMDAALAAIPNTPMRTVRLRWGESIGELAAGYAMSARELLALSGLTAEHRVTGGTELFVPDRAPVAVADNARPLVLVSPVSNPPANRRRVFYRAGMGDTLREIARALDVTREELVAWNQLDPSARVPAGLWLQAWITRDPTMARVRELADVDAAERGTDSAAERVAAQDGRVRLVVTVRPGDTMSSLAARYGLTTGSLARINMRSRHATIVAGEALVVWVTPDRAERERVREADVPRQETPSSAPGTRVATSGGASSTTIQPDSEIAAQSASAPSASSARPTTARDARPSGTDRAAHAP